MLSSAIRLPRKEQLAARSQWPMKVSLKRIAFPPATAKSDLTSCGKIGCLKLRVPKR